MHADALPRPIRVPFAHPIQLTLPQTPGAAVLLRAGNLSRDGMFLRAEEPPPKGTRVSLSLQARGQSLPFAEAEVVWERRSFEPKHSGFGVRFVSFLHPRAKALAEHLVERLSREADEQAPIALESLVPWWRWPVLGGVVLGLSLFGVALARSAPPERVDPINASAESPAPAIPAVEATAPVEGVQPLAQPEAVVAPASEAEPALAELPVEVAIRSGGVRALIFQRDGTEAEVSVRSEGALSGAFVLQSPPRLVLDFKGRKPARAVTLGARGVEWVQRVRTGVLRGGVRVVVDLAVPAKLAGRDERSVRLLLER